jgi:membrane-associated phospholipid phosphatase
MRKSLTRAGAVAVAGLALALVAPMAAQAAPAAFPSDTPPDLVPVLAGYGNLWATSAGYLPNPPAANATTHDFAGTVKDTATLQHDDQLTVWINNHATSDQQFKALQDAEYNYTTTDYDQSITISTALGSVLGPIYVTGRNNGSLPKTSALISSETGTAGNLVSTSTPKNTYAHPRPFLAVTNTGTATAADCTNAKVNSSAQAAIRTGQPYAAADGTLNITKVADKPDDNSVFRAGTTGGTRTLTAGYTQTGICTGGSFPSGHTTTAYQAGITLATLLPELAPEILARASEAGNNRIVLGVHYPLDIMGGRIDGEVALASRWSDTDFRTQVLEPARAELIAYLEQQCGATLATCIAHETAYQDDPYGGAAMPGGTSQVVTDRASAVKVYHERLDYGFAPVTATGAAPSVPAGANNLLLTVFPTLTDDQRTSVLAQTEIASGDPLDLTAAGGAAWERLDLAAAMSATVQLNADGTATVVSTGGTAQVLPVKPTLAATGVETAAPSIAIAAGLLGLGVVGIVVGRIAVRRRSAHRAR